MNTYSPERLATQQAKMKVKFKSREKIGVKGAYGSWASMRERCLCPSRRDYKHYGGANPPVTIYPPWEDFQQFLADMGPRPEGCSLGRILDQGNYEPGNAFWMTRSEQSMASRNKRALAQWGANE